MIRVGIVGYGYWGPNVARNFNGVEECRVVRICDGNQGVSSAPKRPFPA